MVDVGGDDGHAGQVDAAEGDPVVGFGRAEGQGREYARVESHAGYRDLGGQRPLEFDDVVGHPAGIRGSDAPEGHGYQASFLTG